ncbi:MAG: N-acetyltransferase family protein [Pseudomonadota bacterium]
MGGALSLRPARHSDAAAIAAIYAYYVLNGPVTFEVDPPSEQDMAGRIAAAQQGHEFLVAEYDVVVVGYAYAGKLYDRAAYRWAVEASVYVAPDRHRQGIGAALYGDLITILTARGFQTVIGKITLPNSASTLLHERFGFRQAGLLSRIGHKHGLWHDVGIFQLDLGERPKAPADPISL